MRPGEVLPLLVAFVDTTERPGFFSSITAVYFKVPVSGEVPWGKNPHNM